MGILIIIFLIIHYTTPPKSWGDVSQSLIYHQVRKYLLRLRPFSVRYWRPQILLFVNDPRKQYRLVQFCNSLKKGGLFVLGHVIVARDFGTAVPEARQQQAAWTKYVDFSRVKAFVNIAISPAIEWGARNVVLGAGLGGLTPNIVIFGIYNLDEYRKNLPLIAVPTPQNSMLKQNVTSTKYPQIGPSAPRKVGSIHGDLPTDTCRTEGGVAPREYVTILEDMLLRLQINVAIAKGFDDLEFPNVHQGKAKKYIDLWPIQMSAEITTESGEEKQNVLTTNFDTYTLILQLGCILNTVPAWKKAYKLRVVVFVEYESDVEEERGRVGTLLENLRINAEVLVFWLASGDVKSYQVIVNGAVSDSGTTIDEEIDKVLESEEWWQDLQKLRGKKGAISPLGEPWSLKTMLDSAANGPNASPQLKGGESKIENVKGIRSLLRIAKRRQSAGNLGSFGIRLAMTTHRLREDLMNNHPTYASASEDSETSDDDDDPFSRFDDNEASSQGRSSAASADDIMDMDADDQHLEPTPRPLHGSDRRRSDGDSVLYSHPKSSRKARYVLHGPTGSNSQHSIRQCSIKPSIDQVLSSKKTLYTPSTTEDSSRNQDENRPLRKDKMLYSDEQETAKCLRAPDLAQLSSPSTVPKAESSSVKGPQLKAVRPFNPRRTSTAKFSSKPVPKTTVAKDEGPGPSIMFVDNPESPQPHSQRSIYSRTKSSEAENSATGFPFQQSVPLSFNDLPCRAQHLIINELMQQQTGETAVMFTTLPSPVEGTCQSEEDSVGYLSDLEVLCEGLPPILLVHSNSMTVTMNL